MNKSRTSAPKCKVCKNNHSPRDPHIWNDEPKDIVATLREKVHTIKSRPKPKKSRPGPIIEEKSRPEIRGIAIKELYKSLSKELRDLPFDILKNGKVIARVEKV